MVYPMPLINDLLGNLDKMLWFCSLDMPSGFWVVKITERAKEVSVFVTPFGLFQWTRMPFGLKNEPQIYQRLIDNALYGILRIADPAADGSVPSADLTTTGNSPTSNVGVDVFVDGRPETVGKGSVLQQRSYIDDILFGARTWDELCDRLERLMEACDQWGLSVSIPKSHFGMRKVEYLGHAVSSDGLGSKPKNLSELEQLEFPRSVKGIQSFLGSLNYYGKLIEDFAVYAAALHEVTDQNLRSADPHVMGRARSAFEALKVKLVQALLLKHFDPGKATTIVVYACEWVVSPSLLQEHDGTWMPVRFTSRVLKDHEIRYDIVEKETLSLLQILDHCYCMVAGKPLRVITRHSTLAWLFRSKGLQG